jgi:hypothetical protein
MDNTIRWNNELINTDQLALETENQQVQEKQV